MTTTTTKRKQIYHRQLVLVHVLLYHYRHLGRERDAGTVAKVSLDDSWILSTLQEAEDQSGRELREDEGVNGWIQVNDP